MTAMAWDEPGTHLFEAGIDRGVLYIPVDETYAVGQAWSGLLGIEESNEDTGTPYFIDGVKYLDVESIGDFRATLRAFSYPPILDSYTGVAARGNGLFVDGQPLRPFHISYRTLLGNDVDGVDLGYKIHIIWNVLAVPQALTHDTLGADFAIAEFGWDLLAKPSQLTALKPTAHLVLDSTEMDPDLLAIFEATLYGTEETSPTLPRLQDFVSAAAVGLVVDNGDGTWTLTTPDENVTMVSPTQFEVEVGYSPYIDAETYELETSYF